MRHLTIVSAIAVAIIAAPRTAAADAFTISSGSAVVELPGGGTLARTTLTGDGLSASIRWMSGFVVPQSVCPAGCLPGDVLSLSTLLFHSGPINVPPAENDAMGSATLDGVSYPLLAFGGSLSFTGPTVTLPRGSDNSGVTLTGPFVANGVLDAYDINRRDPILVFTAMITGSGTATATMPQNPLTGAYSFGTLRFDFAPALPQPVAEPMTAVLVASGSAIALLRRRRSAL